MAEAFYNSEDSLSSRFMMYFTSSTKSDLRSLRLGGILASRSNAEALDRQQDIDQNSAIFRCQQAAAGDAQFLLLDPEQSQLLD